MGYIHCLRTKLEWKSAVPESPGLTGPKGTKSLVWDRPNAVTGRIEYSRVKCDFFVEAGSSLSDDVKKIGVLYEPDQPCVVSDST